MCASTSQNGNLLIHCYNFQAAKIDFTEQRQSICVKTLLLCVLRLSFSLALLCTYTDILQKEPKLARARKIPEWEAYDAEIARFARKLAEDGTIRSGMAAADANVLANVGSVPQSSSTTAAAVEPSSTSAKDHPDQPRDEL